MKIIHTLRKQLLTLWYSIKTGCRLCPMPSPYYQGLSMGFHPIRIYHPEQGWGKTTERFSEKFVCFFDDDFLQLKRKDILFEELYIIKKH